ncbi:MAG: glycosyltransferase family 4 protein [Desulfohalobiaceae bacterium]|nr:glycosyltransferase family 4 protein [Desulfohalobiaceae bacterium]
MIKIVHLESGRHLYGGARQVQYLLQGLKACPGCRNELICPKGSQIMAGCRDAADRVHPLAMHGDLDPVLPLRLLRLLRRIRPDVVHVHSRRGADVWGGLAAKVLKIPAVVSRRVDDPESGLAVRSKYRLYRRVIAISKGIGRVLVSEGLDPGRLVCVPSAIDAREYRQQGDPEWFRSEFGIREGEQALGVIAQLIERKGHRHLLEALPEILARCPETRVLFFGQGPLQGPLQKKTREMGLEQVVRFCGFRPDLPEILPCLQLVVHPALREGLGVSLLQAAAAGVPIVASKTGGIPEVVRDGHNGLLVEPGDPAGLAGAAAALLKDPDLRREYGLKGREVVGRDFSIESMVSGNYAVYKDILAS